ncbi:MAG TPA: hypothetical protein VMG12_25555 [Polyangiaceae bacterium]|nr:hypothetical protein [Polyangiaceae bacterium]
MTLFGPARAGRLALAAGCLLGACATRTVPDQWPAGAAASAEAATPRPVSVTRSLEAEPGAELESADAGSAPGGHGAHHHGGHYAH